MTGIQADQVRVEDCVNASDATTGFGPKFGVVLKIKGDASFVVRTENGDSYLCNQGTIVEEDHILFYNARHFVDSIRNGLAFKVSRPNQSFPSDRFEIKNQPGMVEEQGQINIEDCNQAIRNKIARYT